MSGIKELGYELSFASATIRVTPLDTNDSLARVTVITRGEGGPEEVTFVVNDLAIADIQALLVRVARWGEKEIHR